MGVVWSEKERGKMSVYGEATGRVYEGWDSRKEWGLYGECEGMVRVAMRDEAPGRAVT